MAESSSPAMPGDVEWLPGPGGGRVLRVHTPPNVPPPALALRLAGGGEARIDAHDAAEYVIPPGLEWSAAWLQWPDGARAPIPPPHGPHAEVIELRPRREPRDAVEAPGGAAAPDRVGGAPDAGTLPSRPDERVGGAPDVGVQPAQSGEGPPSSPDAVGQAGAVPRSLAWTAPPDVGVALSDAEAQWRERRADFARDLAAAHAAIARARDGERTARDAVAAALQAARADLLAARAARAADAAALSALQRELAAERAAHAVTREAVGTLADALAAARAELAAAKTEVTAARAEAVAAGAGGETEIASPRVAIERERAARAAAEAAGRGDAARAAAGAGGRGDAARAAAGAAGRGDAARAAAEAAVDGAVGAAEATGAGGDLPQPASGRDLASRAREQAQAAAATPRRPAEEAAALLAGLDAAAAALRAAVPPPSDPADAPVGGTAAPTRYEPETAGGASATAADTEEPLPPAAAESSATDAGTPAESAGSALAGVAAGPGAEVAVAGASQPAARALVATDGGHRLRRALVALAREDPAAAGALLVGLLPTQGAVIDDTLTYDLTVRGIGTFAISLADGMAHVTPLQRPRGRRQARFHLAAEPLALAELLSGERRRVSRFRRRAKLSGRRRSVRELAALRDTRRSLADAVRAGAELDPGPLLQALRFAVEPDWTRGYAFTVAQQVVERAWHITARDGAPLEVVERPVGEPADATVTMTRRAFERLLRDEPQVAGDLPRIDGDRDAVAALKRWTDLARGA